MRAFINKKTLTRKVNRKFLGCAAILCERKQHIIHYEYLFRQGKGCLSA